MWMIDMKDRYLEVTFRRGRLLAAYFYLPRRAGEKASRTKRFDGGFVVDYSQDGRPIGIELTSPRAVTLDQLNALLLRLGEAPAEQRDLAPLAA
jgi:hypothetical protein